MLTPYRLESFIFHQAQWLWSVWNQVSQQMVPLKLLLQHYPLLCCWFGWRITHCVTLNCSKRRSPKCWVAGSSSCFYWIFQKELFGILHHQTFGKQFPYKTPPKISNLHLSNAILCKLHKMTSGDPISWEGSLYCLPNFILPIDELLIYLGNWKLITKAFRNYYIWIYDLWSILKNPITSLKWILYDSII